MARTTPRNAEQYGGIREIKGMVTYREHTSPYTQGQKFWTPPIEYTIKVTKAGKPNAIGWIRLTKDVEVYWGDIKPYF